MTGRLHLIESGDAFAGDAAEELPLVYTERGAKRRRIRGMDLGAYTRPVIPNNRNLAWRVAWYLTNALFFQSTLISLIPGLWKAGILRLFGARIGRSFVCKLRVTTKYPWFLEMGDHVWLGEMVWIDNHCLVRIGSNVCISQGAYLFTGNHDWNDPNFKFLSSALRIEDSTCVGARAFIAPGSVLSVGIVVSAGHIVCGSEMF